MVTTIDALINMIKYVDGKGDSGYNARLELWKTSLKVNTKDKEIEKYLKIVIDASERGLVRQFTLISTGYCQRKLRDLIEFLERRRDFKVLQFSLKEAVRDIFEKLNLPEYLFVEFVDSTPQAFNDAVRKYFKEVGDEDWRVLTAFLAPGGVIDEVAELQGEYQSVKVGTKTRELSRVRHDFIWVPYLLSISYVAVFLYAHEQIGRYIRELDDNLTTDQTYFRHRKRLRFMIDEAKDACLMLEEIVDS
jgi:hypothetical protein